MRRFLLMTLALGVLAPLWAQPVPAGERFIILQSTTSTENSGLLDAILPRFTAKTGIEVRVVAVGTGQALKNAANGDGDVVLVHSRAAEDKFVADGFGVQRFDVMYNDYVIVGPESDPAGIASMDDTVAAFKKISEARAPFASRGDDSGTHKKELSLWRAAGVDVGAASGGWYRDTGSGMGATLNAAKGMGAYTLSDRGTWISFGNRDGFAVLVEGDERLFNPYGVMLVTPKRHESVKAADGQAFIDWLIGPEGQESIAAFRLDGQPLFFPAARPTAMKKAE